MTSEPVAMNRSILARLKDETRPEHDAIEQVLDLMDGTLTLAAYRRRLEQFHGFYRPVEDASRSLKVGASVGSTSAPEARCFSSRPTFGSLVRKPWRISRSAGSCRT